MTNTFSSKTWIEYKQSESPFLLDKWKPLSSNDITIQKKEFEKIKIFFLNGPPGIPILFNGPPGTGKHCKMECIWKEIYGEKYLMYGRWKITEKWSDVENEIWYEVNSIGAREYKWLESNINEKDVYENIKDWLQNHSLSPDEKKWIVIPNLDKFSETIQKSFCTLVEKTEKYVQWIFFSHIENKISPVLKSRCNIFYTREYNSKELENFNDQQTLEKLKESPYYEWLNTQTLSIPKIGKLSFLIECLEKTKEDTFHPPYEWFIIEKIKQYWFEKKEIPLKTPQFEEMRALCHALFHLQVPVEIWYRWLVNHGIMHIEDSEKKIEWVKYLTEEQSKLKKVFRELFVFEMSFVQCQFFLWKN